MLKKDEKVYAVVVWKEVMNTTKKVLILCETKEIAEEVAKEWKHNWGNTKIIEMNICKSSEEGEKGIII